MAIRRIATVAILLAALASSLGGAAEASGPVPTPPCLPLAGC